MTLEDEFLKDMQKRFNWAFVRITTALGQLDDKQLWYRPSPTSNSVGIILQHLSGNLNQWILEALGGREYKRNRPMEFEDKHQKSKQDFARTFSQLATDVQETVTKVDPDSLLSSRRIQDSDQTVFSALMLAITHMELHTGQILFIAKMMLNEKYVEAKRPISP